MTTRWRPDSCDCIILFETGTTTFVQWEQKCDLHKALDGQTLLDTVLTHNRGFEISSGQQNSQSMRIANVATKRLARAAILAAGATTKNSAFSRPRLFP